MSGAAERQEETSQITIEALFKIFAQASTSSASISDGVEESGADSDPEGGVGERAGGGRIAGVGAFGFSKGHDAGIVRITCVASYRHLSGSCGYSGVGITGASDTDVIGSGVNIPGLSCGR